MARFARWKRADQDFIQAELFKQELKKLHLPEYTKEFGFDTTQTNEWFNAAEGQRIADYPTSFQTSSCGRPKRTDKGSGSASGGHGFGAEKTYIPIFDNGATSTHLELLTKAYTVTYL